MLGATGTIGRATAHALARRGHEVVCLIRAGANGGLAHDDDLRRLPGVTLRCGDVLDRLSLARDGFSGEKCDVVMSCLASRSGAPQDAWAIDFQAHADVLALAREAGVEHFVLLSAICVQKPLLAFQHAKLAFEKALIESGMAYSIVRPTAFFKSLSGQVERVRRGKPFLVFGDGELTACKPIGDRDLADYLVACLHEPSRRNRILPIGGPGPAITPRLQAECLFRLLGRPMRLRRVPVAMLDGIIALLDGAGKFSSALRDRAEFARIGRYYATESMLVLDPQTGRYDADATPSTGVQTLFDHYADLISGRASVERGAHSVF